MTPNEQQVSLDDLQTRMIRRIAKFGIFVGVFVLWANLPVIPYPGYDGIPAALLIILGAAILNTVDRHLQLTQMMLVLGCNICFVLALSVRADAWMPFLSLLFIPIAGAFSPTAGGITMFMTLVSVIIFDLTGYRSYDLNVIIPLIVAAGIVTRITSSALYTAFHWTHTMYQQMQVLLEETRQHRAELTRVLKASEISNEALRRLQNELIYARKQAEQAQVIKQQFAANVSHELRTPLNLILGFSEIMYQSPNVYGNMIWPPRLRQDVAKIYRSSQHLLRLVDDILDLSHFETLGFLLNLEATPVTSFLHETAEIGQDLFVNSPIPLHINIAPDLPIVDIDRTRIRQVILNLLSNAKRHTTQGYVRLSAQSNYHTILITVEDTGIGIAPDQLPHIFEEFYQVDPSLRRKTGGAGLGLAISRKFVEAHGGQLFAESVLGSGSAFHFQLPVTQRHSSNSIDDRSAGLRPCVLVWGTSQEILNLLQRHNSDYELIPITQLQTIEEMIQLHHPRALLIDTSDTMPPPHPPGLPVITFTLPERFWLAQLNMPYQHLTKPVPPQQILQALAPITELESVLIVDDDVNFIHMLERTLQTTDHSIQVMRAYNGAEAIEIIRTKQPSLILLDLVMPQMSGYELLTMLQENSHLWDIRIIILTSITYAESVTNLRAGSITIERKDGLFLAENVRYLRSVLCELDPANGNNTIDKL